MYEPIQRLLWNNSMSRHLNSPGYFSREARSWVQRVLRSNQDIIAEYRIADEIGHNKGRVVEQPMSLLDKLRQRGAI